MFNPGLLRLLQLTDPALPVGGYAHSSGLETYVQQGLVHNLATAGSFISSMLENNIRYTDAALASLAYDAAKEKDLKTIRLLDEECHAVKLPNEIREASRKLGLRLLKVFQPLSTDCMLQGYRSAIESGTCTGHYSIAFGIIAGALDIPKADALTGFYYNAAAGMVTNSVKLIPLGQQAGQELLFSLHPLIGRLVETSLEPDAALIGFSCTGFDIRCMQHEQLYSRLYMS